MTVVDDLIEWSAIRFLDRGQGPICWVSESEEVKRSPALWYAEDLADEF